MRTFAYITLLVAVAFAISCSYHVRSADPGIDYSELSSQLDNLTNNFQTAATGDSSVFQSLRQTATIYYSQGPGPLGSIASVVSFDEYSYFGLPGYIYSNINEAQVYFLDGTAGSGRQTALLVALQPKDTGSYNLSYFSSSGPPDISDG